MKNINPFQSRLQSVSLLHVQISATWVAIKYTKFKDLASRYMICATEEIELVQYKIILC